MGSILECIVGMLLRSRWSVLCMIDGLKGTIFLDLIDGLKGKTFFPDLIDVKGKKMQSGLERKYRTEPRPDDWEADLYARRQEYPGLTGRTMIAHRTSSTLPMLPIPKASIPFARNAREFVSASKIYRLQNSPCIAPITRVRYSSSKRRSICVDTKQS